VFFFLPQNTQGSAGELISPQAELRWKYKEGKSGREGTGDETRKGTEWQRKRRGG